MPEIAPIEPVQGVIESLTENIQDQKVDQESRKLALKRARQTLRQLQSYSNDFQNNLEQGVSAAAPALSRAISGSIAELRENIAQEADLQQDVAELENSANELETISNEGAPTPNIESSRANVEVQVDPLVKKLEQLLPDLQGPGGDGELERLTDLDLIETVAERSQIEQQLHTSVLVEQEVVQQNRWVGRLLSQLG